ncbi:MAG: hypothetical protein P8177_07715 [Gemmatimonadota bacterium]|jgi:hypothetical protein
MGGSRSATFHGVIGGVIAATVIVVFFLIVDVARGDALDTPAFLANVLLGRGEGDAGLGLVAGYTILHYAVFAGLGAGAAALLARLRAPATFLLGLVVGFLLFDIVFYASLAVTGVDVVLAIGWPTFLAGNLLGGVTLMLYLASVGVARGRSWSDVLGQYRIVREGLIAGVLGALAVAAWFFVIDLFLGRVLYTPAAIGSALFHGAASPEAVRVTAGTVLGYTAVHFTGFLTMGLVFAALATQAEERPPLLMGLVLLFVTFETLLLGLVAILASWLLDVLPWWSIGLSNIVAAGIMVLYLWRAHADSPTRGAYQHDVPVDARTGRERI